MKHIEYTPQRLSERSIDTLSDAEALDHLALLIDASSDVGFKLGLERALRQLDNLNARILEPVQATLAQYYRANAWSGLDRLAGTRRDWGWEREEVANEMLALSRAATHAGFAKLDALRRCQILTNRSNLLNTVGRFVDAIEGWDAALAIIPDFAMALGNRASGLSHYARALYDPGHRRLFLMHALRDAERALGSGAIWDSEQPPETRAAFRAVAHQCAVLAGVEAGAQDHDLYAFPLGRSRRERRYRLWCLNERLFLNPLNDLGPLAIAATDVLTLPSMSFGLAEGRDGRPPRIVGFYNQLKQEYVSARFNLFEALTAAAVHFSDRDVLIYDTLDYPTYSLAMERARTAFRVAYSLLDKVAFFVDAYWSLGKKPAGISFRTVWRKEGRASLLDRFRQYPNWPLRGLYWLSKDLFDEQMKDATAADARDLHEIRNHLEHRYLQVHEGWAWKLAGCDLRDALAMSVSSDEMFARALRVMRIARSALIHLSLAVTREEVMKAETRGDTLVATMPLHVWEDRDKRPL